MKRKLMKNNIIKFRHSLNDVEILSDIAYCKSVFDKHELDLESNFMNPDVVHAYQFVNMIRINAKSDEVYNSALKVIAYYGDLLYGKDTRINHWRAQRLLEKGYELTKVVMK